MAQRTRVRNAPITSAPAVRAFLFLGSDCSTPKAASAGRSLERLENMHSLAPARVFVCEWVAINLGCFAKRRVGACWLASPRTLPQPRPPRLLRAVVGARPAAPQGSSRAALNGYCLQEPISFCDGRRRPRRCSRGLVVPASLRHCLDKGLR